MAKNIVMITGHSGAIGNAMCEMFAANNYFVIGIDQVETKNVDYEALVDLCELATNEQEKQSLTRELLRLIQPHDNLTLINNAAVQIVKPFNELEIADLHRSMTVNCVAPFSMVKILCDFAKPQLKTVINISSIHANLSKKNFLAYSVSKAALSGLTRSLSIDLGSTVRVCEIQPAAIETTMLKDGFNHDTASIETLKTLHPSQSIGQPIDVASLAFMISQQPSAFINGCVINLDGGISNCLRDPD